MKVCVAPKGIMVSEPLWSKIGYVLYVVKCNLTHSVNNQECPWSIFTAGGLFAQLQLTLCSHQQNALPSLQGFCFQPLWSAFVCFLPIPSLPIFLPLTCQCDGCLVHFVRGLLAGWCRFPAMRARVTLSRGCLPKAEAHGYPRGPNLHFKQCSC